MKKQRILTGTACFLAAILLLVTLSSVRSTAEAMYVARVDLAVQTSPGFAHKYPKNSWRWYDASPNTVGAILTSEKTLQSAARELTLFNVTLYPERLLSTVNVSPVPGSNAIGIEITSPDPKEAQETAEAVAAAGQKVYFEAVNTMAPGKIYPDTLSLKVVKPVQVSRVPFLSAHLVMFGWIFGALAALVIGFMVGRLMARRRGSGKSAAVGKAILVVCVIVLVASVGFRLYSLPRKPYGAKVKLSQRPSPYAAVHPDPGKSLEFGAWCRQALSPRLMKRSAKTLGLFNVSVSPEWLRSATAIEGVPGTEISLLTVTAIGPKKGGFDNVEAAADVVASEMQRDYFVSNNPPGTPLASPNASRLYMLEEAHIFPVVSPLWSPAGYAAVGSLMFILGSVGSRLRRRRGMAE